MTLDCVERLAQHDAGVSDPVVVGVDGGGTKTDVVIADLDGRELAVATGMHDKAELARAAPDLLLDDLLQTEEFLQRLDEAKAA